jgi:hypothetical protein
MKFWEVERKTGDAYLDGLLWAIRFVYTFAAVSILLLVVAYFLGRAIHGPGPHRASSFRAMAADLARIRPARD